MLSNKKKKFSLIIVVLVVGSFISPVKAADFGSVVINEIAWMGTTVDYNDEWIELYNNTEAAIDLNGWTLQAQDGTPKISLSGIISAGGFFILERTNDQTLPNITADQIYTGALGNSGENLELKDRLGNLIDLINCASEWFGGDNSTKQTMERKNPRVGGNNPYNWGTSQNPGGTPKAQNSVFQSSESTPTPTPTPTPTSTFTSTSTPTPTLTPAPTLTPTPTSISTPMPTAVSSPTPLSLPISTSSPTLIPTPSLAPATEPVFYSRSVLINEFLADPVGDDAQGEWIELFNEGNEPVDLGGWKLTDKTSKFTIPQNTLIGAKKFLVFYRTVTKLSINNDGEILSLFDPRGELAFKVSYEGKAPEGQTLARQPDGQWVWSSVVTPGSQNIIKTAGAPKSSSKTVSLPAREETTGSSERDSGARDQNLASLGSSFRQNYKIVGLAVLLGLFSVAGILILKRFLV